ncbi:MAG: hypothetical protein EHM21_08210, partial [Chloroflexi bacterium]
MIEISHQQAQRLLRANLDSHIPNEQWTMLQAHLESCQECRLYAKQLGGLEKSLRRALYGGWAGVQGPGQDTARLALVQLRRRAQARKALLYAGAAAALLAVIVFIGAPGIRARLAGSPSAGSIPVTQVTEAPASAQAATALPTIAAGQFPHIVAYESRRDGIPTGDSEIYLLNPGSQPVNLTDNPAQDTDPAWSPDGEWLAFLSDRNEKPELYVTNITGSRVVQLTHAPNVTWKGPLSWSPDGRWIALSGSRDQQGDQNWVYLAALDGSGARAVAGSRGGESPKFAPSGYWPARPGALAYNFSGDNNDGISITHLETGEQAVTRWRANPLVPPPAAGSSFDWSLDGAGLAFVASSLNPLAYAGEEDGDARDEAQDGGSRFLEEPGSQVVAVSDLNESLSNFSGDGNPMGNGHLQVASSRWPGAYRAVTWTPEGGIAFLEDLDDARANTTPDSLPEGCWTVQVTQPLFRQRGSSPISPISFGGLCVVGGMQRAS